MFHCVTITSSPSLSRAHVPVYMAIGRGRHHSTFPVAQVYPGLTVVGQGCLRRPHCQPRKQGCLVWGLGFSNSPSPSHTGIWRPGIALPVEWFLTYIQATPDS